MVAPFLHYEILGPRADLDAWLGTMQDAGVCHLADALRDLEGEAGIGRPELREEEVHAGLVRSEAARALRGVARLLPPTPRRPGPQRRPDWGMGPGGLGEQDLLALKDEARDIAASIRTALERTRACEEAVADLDASAAAVAAMDAVGTPRPRGFLFRLPAGSRRARRLRRLLARDGIETLLARGERSTVLLVPGDAPPPSTSELAARFGADAASLPADIAALECPEAKRVLAARLAEALQEESDARAALRTQVDAVGDRGRFLLDAVEDADARLAARRHLASTEHVVAARVFVRPEDEPTLRERLHGAHGDVVVMRPLAESDDLPTLPRRIAPVPFAALRGLLPERYGEVAPSALLALVAPLAVGIVWADVLGGLLLLTAGGLMGWGAGPGSPRRDTALLAQIGGFTALVLGFLGGRAFGPAGEAWFGAHWGAAPYLLSFLPGAVSPWLAPFVGVLAVLGGFSLAVGLWGGVLALRDVQQGRRARASSTFQAALPYVLVAGVAAAVAAPTQPLGGFGLLAPACAIAALFLAGPRRFLMRTGLDLVGVLRLVAVAGAALVVFDVVSSGWVHPGVIDVTLGPLCLLVAALAVVADPGHMAMGVPYDLALGGRRLRRPFEPFARRSRALENV